MKLEAAARSFAQTDSEYAGWIRHLKDLDNAYDIFLLHKPVTSHVAQSSRPRS